MSTPPLSIRTVLATDIPAVARLHVAVWQAAYRGLLPDDYLDALSVERRVSMWHSIVAAEQAPSLVAADAGGIVGFLLGGPVRDEDAGGAMIGEVYAIYVAPDHWGAGVGAMLMRHGLASLLAQGYQEVVVWVLRGNVRAINFYGRMGFQPDGAEKTDSRGAVVFEEIRYRRGLTAAT